MRVIEEVPICKIIIDREVYSNTTKIFANVMRTTNHKFPPIHIQDRGDGFYLIKDGRHRISACKLIGREKILAKFWRRK